MVDETALDAPAAGTAEAPAPAAETTDSTLTFNLADSPDTAPVGASIDLTRIPTAARRELLETKVTELVNGRAHAAVMRFNAATKEYKAKCDADPTFNGEAPKAPNIGELAQAAIADLYEGKVRQRSKGGQAKTRVAKDPVDAVVTQAVIRELFAKRKTEKPGTKYQEVVKEVGESGIAYLNARAVTLAAGDKKRLDELTKSIENKYLKPARQMVSVNAKGEAQDNELL